MINVSDYAGHSEPEFNEEYTLPEKIDRISFSYDGGRVSVYINGVEVFENNCMSSDFEIELVR